MVILFLHEENNFKIRAIFCCCCIVYRSVARGGGAGGLEPPHWLVKYAKSHVFNVFEADFLWKIENSPPIGKQPLLKRLNFRIWPKNQSQFRRKPFFWPPDFGRKKPLNFGRKISLNFGEDLFFFFFGDHLILGGKILRISELSEKFRLNFRTNRVKLIQNNENSGQGRLHFSHSFKIAPPPLFQILATRLIVYLFSCHSTTLDAIYWTICKLSLW